jgi:hypothetical protein
VQPVAGQRAEPAVRAADAALTTALQTIARMRQRQPALRDSDARASVRALRAVVAAMRAAIGRQTRALMYPER